MQIKNLTILGLSEATLSMIFDILESNQFFPKIKILNNLNLTPSKEYINPNFKIDEITQLTNTEGNFIIGGVKPNVKTKIRESFKDLLNKQFLTLVSSNSDISKTTNLGFGVVVNTMTSIAGFSKIDDFVFINRNCSIGHHTYIGKFTTLNPGVNVAGNVVIGENCQIGIGTNISDNIKIGKNVIIGAGSLVMKDIPDNVVVYGNPCKIVRVNN